MSDVKAQNRKPELEQFLHNAGNLPVNAELAGIILRETIMKLSGNRNYIKRVCGKCAGMHNYFNTFFLNLQIFFLASAYDSCMV